MVTDAFSDYVVGHGELWCAQLFAATVRRLGTDCGFMDTREASAEAQGSALGVAVRVGMSRSVNRLQKVRAHESRAHAQCSCCDDICQPAACLAWWALASASP